MVKEERMARRALAGVEQEEHIGSWLFVKTTPKSTGNRSPIDTCRNSEVSMSDRLQFTLVNLVLSVVILQPLCYITYNIVVFHFDYY